MSRNYDNWERLVGATLKREQLRALARADSLDSRSSFSSIQSDLPFHSPLHRDLGTSRSPYVKAFTLMELKNATRNFRHDFLLGEGAFGHVSKGWIDENTLKAVRPGSGLPIAVKKLKTGSLQGHREWLAEVNYLGQLHHPNLIKLIGYCCEDDHRLLVYEFMPKGSLDNHLFKRPHSLPWATRIKIATDAARVLSFLHDGEPQVIHRNFHVANILLDSRFNARLSDFGLARDGPTGDRTHVTTQVMGTYGYAAPEYVATGHLSAKSDVYSFGVVLLELLSGRRAMDTNRPAGEQLLVEWARPYMCSKKKVFWIMDIKLKGQCPREGVYTVASIALQCLSHNPKERPHMANILAALQKLPSPESTIKH